MEPRDKWIDELVRRQDNVDPIRRIPNGALFQGTLIKGNLRLNKFQRFAAILVGFIGLVFGGFVLVRAIADIRSRDFSDPMLPGLLLSFPFGSPGGSYEMPGSMILKRAAPLLGRARSFISQPAQFFPGCLSPDCPTEPLDHA